MTQQRLPLEDAEATYWQRRSDLELSLIRADADLYLWRLMMLIFHCAERTGGPLRASYQELAASGRYGMWCSASKARATVGQAKRYRWVTVEEVRGVGGQQAANKYALDWPQILAAHDLSKPLGGRPEEGKPDALLRQGPALTRQGPVLIEHHIRNNNSSCIPSYVSNTPAAPALQCAGGGAAAVENSSVADRRSGPMVLIRTQKPAAGPVTAAWEAAAEALDAVGYQRFVELLGEAKRLGMVPGEILAIVEMYRANERHFDGPGAIAVRVRTGDWPTSAKLVDPAAEEQARRDRAAADAKRRQDEADAAAAEAVRIEGLETLFGPMLDSLAEADLFDLAGSHVAKLPGFRRGDWRTPGDALRAYLLDRLAKLREAA